MRLFSIAVCAGLIGSASMASAFCDDILATQVLCLTEEAEEIKLCASSHPETGAPALELYVTPSISDGPVVQLAAETPFGMTPGTGGYPWDTFEYAFLHEGGRAVLALKMPIGSTDTAEASVWLDLFGRGTAPERTLSCMTPALSAEVQNLMDLRGVSMNTFRTGPSGDSAPYYQPRVPIAGASPYGSYDCREVGAVPANEGTENGQIALYAAPYDDAAILGYAFPEDLGHAFECAYRDGFSGVIWGDPDKGDGAGGYLAELDHDARLAACALTPEDWPADMAYFGKCSSAWIKEANIAGFGG